MAQNLRQRSQVNETAKHEKSSNGSVFSMKQPEKNRLLRLADLPEWANDNEHIHTGYRQISNSIFQSIESCFHVHNESGNIYSHFLAAAWMIALPVVLYPHAKTHYPDANEDDWTVFGLFFLGGFLCYTFSVVYHVFSNHSYEVCNFCLRLDLFGITTVTAGCFPPGVWYTFPCAGRSTKIFWIVVSTHGKPPAV